MARDLHRSTHVRRSLDYTTPPLSHCDVDPRGLALSPPTHPPTHRRLSHHPPLCVRGHRRVLIGNRVLDVASFRHMHPGGNNVLTQYAGKDATDAFYGLHRHEVSPVSARHCPMLCCAMLRYAALCCAMLRYAAPTQAPNVATPPAIWQHHTRLHWC
jgi:hypothetical protein